MHLYLVSRTDCLRASTSARRGTPGQAPRRGPSSTARHTAIGGLQDAEDNSYRNNRCRCSFTAYTARRSTRFEFVILLRLFIRFALNAIALGRKSSQQYQQCPWPRPCTSWRKKIRKNNVAVVATYKTAGSESSQPYDLFNNNPWLTWPVTQQVELLVN